jgi:SdrD B-like domain/His Kinase A (phospho-acceptor) domain
MVEERTATIAEQAEKLRQLDRLKSQLFANVSHEFRSPLTLMIGPLQDALAGDFGPLSGDLAHQIAMVESNARRLLGLVDQLLDVARLESGRLRLSVWRSDLAALARRMVESFLPFAERRGIDFSLAAPAEPLEAWFDEAQLEKVFANLLSNALKFTPPGGTVRVAVRPLEAMDRVAVVDANPVSGCTPVVTLAANENNPDVDAGLIATQLAALGNYVWFDRNNDGVQNESTWDGVNGVTVRLYVDNGNGTQEPGTGDALVATTVTANDVYGQPGYYLFDGLIPGLPYFVQFVRPASATAFTTQNAGGDDTVDSRRGPDHRRDADRDARAGRGEPHSRRRPPRGRSSTPGSTSTATAPSTPRIEDYLVAVAGLDSCGSRAAASPDPTPTRSPAAARARPPSR